MLRFSDGIDIDTSGPMRTLKLKDGWYAVGEGLLVPCKDQEEAQKTVDSEKNGKVTIPVRNNS